MTTYNTGNPIGSKDPRDLYDNAENLDGAVNDRSTQVWKDRMGIERLTWHGIEQVGTGDSGVAVDAASRALASAVNSMASANRSRDEANRAEAAADMSVNSSNAVWRETRSQLNSVNPGAANTPGVVFGDSNPDNNGYYIWTGSAWTKTQLQPVNQENFGAYRKEATFAQDWNLISESGIYRSNSNGAIPDNGPGPFAHMVVEHTESTGGRAWQLAKRAAGSGVAPFWRSRGPDGAWSEWTQILLDVGVGSAYNRSSLDSAGLFPAAYATLTDLGEFIPVTVSAGAPGPVVVSEQGSIITRNKFTPHKGIFLVYVRAWATPVDDDLVVRAVGYDINGENITEAKTLGFIASGNSEGLFVADFQDEASPLWAISVQSLEGERIVLATTSVRRYIGASKGEDINITQTSILRSRYDKIALFGNDQVFDLNASNWDRSRTDFIKRNSPAGTGTVLDSRKAIIKPNRSFQVVLSSTSEETRVILHQHSSSSQLPGRLQMYVNRGGPIGALKGDINLYIEGMDPQLPSMPYKKGEKLSITIDVDDDNVVSLYYGDLLWGRGLAANGIADHPLGILGGGLTGDTETNIYSITCIDYDDRLNHIATSIKNSLLVPGQFFQERTGRYAVQSSFGDIRYRGAPELNPPASLTKVLSALVILDRGDLADIVEVLPEDATSGSGNNLQAGDLISLEDLLYNMMLPSSNVSASVAARHVGGDVATFVEWMNEKAQSIGMFDSFFVNPHGLGDEEQITTADDMLRLCKAASSYNELHQFWGAESREISITGPNARTININSSVDMISDPGVVGGKTGTLSGGFNNLMIYAVLEDGSKFWGVVLRASSDSNRYVGMREALDATRRVSRYETFL